MKVLVACEFSGIVRDAFIARGHDAISCDLLPTEKPGPHYQGDVFDCLMEYDYDFDLMIAHPPCTYLSVSGIHWTTRGLRDPGLTESALMFVKQLMHQPIDRICIENPVSIISTRIRKPDQIIQPWMFGHDASKKTCLWLKNLPKLEVDYRNVIAPNGWSKVLHTFVDYIDESEDELIYKSIDGISFATKQIQPGKMRWANQTPAGQDKKGPSPDRWKTRSRTFQGIADVMAEQWGNL